MSGDHYVARTYLKHFSDSGLGGMLHGYGKRSGKRFECWPADVCKTWNDDLNTEFLSEPNLLGDYRQIFEPEWNRALAAILSNRFNDADKFVIAGYFACLKTCTPTWKRVGGQTYVHVMTSILREKIRHQKASGKVDQQLVDGLAMIEKGHLLLEVDPQWIKAQATVALLNYAWQFYNQDWTIQECPAGCHFITSDNPAVQMTPEIGHVAVHYLPLNSSFCLRLQYSRRVSDLGNDAARYVRRPPLGQIRYRTASEETVAHINKLVCMGADELIFASRKTDDVGALVTENSTYKLVSEFIQIHREAEDSVVDGFMIKFRKSQ